MSSSWVTINKYPILQPVISRDIVKIVDYHLNIMNLHKVKLCRPLDLLVSRIVNRRKNVSLHAVLLGGG